MKKVLTLALVLIMGLVIFSGCDNMDSPVETANISGGILKSNGITTEEDALNDPTFQELISKLREAGFEWYNHYEELATKDIMFTIKPELTILEESLVTIHDKDGVITNVSGTSLANDIFEFRTFTQYKNDSHKMVSIIIYENGQKTLGVTYHSYMKKGEVHSLIKYYPDESYNILIKIKDLDRNIRFSNNKQYYLQMEFYGNSISEVVSPKTLDREFALNVKSLIKASNKPPMQISGLNTALLEPFILEKLVELNTFFNHLNTSRDIYDIWSFEDQQIALDILGTGVADIFGPLVTGIYGAASYLSVRIGATTPAK